MLAFVEWQKRRPRYIKAGSRVTADRFKRPSWTGHAQAASSRQNGGCYTNGRHLRDELMATGALGAIV